MPVLSIFIALFIGIGLITSLVKVIKSKKYMDIVTILLLLLFYLFSVVSLLLGGSAFHDVKSDYELYQVGHYYLFSHGIYTEVTYAQYLLMIVLEVIGLLSLPLVLLWKIVCHFVSMFKGSR